MIVWPPIVLGRAVSYGADFWLWHVLDRVMAAAIVILKNGKNVSVVCSVGSHCPI